MAAGDVDRALGLFSPGAEMELVPLQQSGAASDLGRTYLSKLKAAFPDMMVHVRGAFAGTDGTAVVEVTVDGVQAADFFGVINQEKHLDLEQSWLLHVTDDKIDWARAYWCQNRLYRRLGVKRLDHVTLTA
jgi:ketosteroid isomerase-like protein